VWRVAVLTAGLLLAVLAIQFWPGGQGQVPKQSLGTRDAATDRPCGKAILQDWVSDARIDGTYARSCYEAARKLIPEDGERLYGSGGALVEALEEKLR
jgi:hypothetical protein